MCSYFFGFCLFFCLFWSACHWSGYVCYTFTITVCSHKLDLTLMTFFSSVISLVWWWKMHIPMFHEWLEAQWSLCLGAKFLLRHHIGTLFGTLLAPKSSQNWPPKLGRFSPGLYVFQGLLWDSSRGFCVFTYIHMRRCSIFFPWVPPALKVKLVYIHLVSSNPLPISESIVVGLPCQPFPLRKTPPPPSLNFSSE